jgi:hypothetical protein
MWAGIRVPGSVSGSGSGIGFESGSIKKYVLLYRFRAVFQGTSSYFNDFTKKFTKKKVPCSKEMITIPIPYGIQIRITASTFWGL